MYTTNLKVFFGYLRDMCGIHFFMKLSKMPKCKNNPSRHYKGHEPSPKGNGWCASGEKIGKKRKGTDGKM